MTKDISDSLAFWKQVSIALRPELDAASFRIEDDGYQPLSPELTQEEIEKESDSMDELFATLDDL